MNRKFSMKLNILWFLKIFFDDVCACCTFFVLALVAKMYSYQLFVVAALFFCYHLLDTIVFIWNYECPFLVHWSMLLVVTVSLVVLLITPKKTGKYKSFI
jgi:hypothetical protein